MVTRGTPWQVLDLPRQASAAEVRQRYAALIKQYRPDTHPEDFARIREAYEVVLHLARQREAHAQQAEEAAESLADAQPAATERPSASDEPAGAAQVAAAPAEVVAQATVPEALPRQSTEAAAAASAPPPLPAFVPQLQALAQARGEVEALLAQRRLLADSRRVSLDERQALEFALLHWFLHAEQPPLLLMFDAGRAFGWHREELRLASWIGPGAARQLALLLTLARDEVFARYRAGNRWLRRLFDPAARAPGVGFSVPLLEAQGWEQRWHYFAAQTQLPSLTQRLNPRATRRLAGRVVTSTDFGAALLASLFFALPLAEQFPDLAGPLRVALPAIGGAPLVAGLRLLCARVRRQLQALPAGSGRRRTVDWVKAHAQATLLGAGLSTFTLFMAAMAADLTWLVAGLGRLLLALAGLTVSAFVLWVMWWFVQVLERLAAVALHWREALDRWEMAQLMQAAPDAADAASPASPFGPRLPWWRRLRELGAARRLQKHELQRHDRPPRAQPPRVVRPATRSPSPWSQGQRRGGFNWWWIWLALAVVRGIASLHH